MCECMNEIPVIDMAATGANITRLRVQSGYSVKDLQRIFGFVTPQAIYKWQHGSALPTIDNLLMLSMIFGTRIEDILVVNMVHIGTAVGAARPYESALHKDAG